MTCKKCEDFANKNIEGFVISKDHTCLKLDPEGEFLDEEEEELPKAKSVYRSAVHSEAIESYHPKVVSAAKSDKKSSEPKSEKKRSQT